MSNTQSVLRWQLKNRIKYSQVVEFARKNYGDLNLQKEILGVSIADQLEMYCDIPNNVADSIEQYVRVEKQSYVTP